jgi:hypothetical protein
LASVAAFLISSKTWALASDRERNYCSAAICRHLRGTFGIAISDLARKGTPGIL